MFLDDDLRLTTWVNYVCVPSSASQFYDINAQQREIHTYRNKIVVEMF